MTAVYSYLSSFFMMNESLLTTKALSIIVARPLDSNSVISILTNIAPTLILKYIFKILSSTDQELLPTIHHHTMHFKRYNST